MAMTGTEGCDTWKDAEAALYQAADVIPFANSVVPIFGKNAEFKLIGKHRADEHPDGRLSPTGRTTTESTLEQMTEAVALPTYGFRTLSENRWVRFTVRRTGRLLVSLWVLVTAAFLMIHLMPGDPVRAALGPDGSPGARRPVA